MNPPAYAPLSGLALSERFYREAVGPLLTKHFPHLPYAAALIGSGSEVLGCDDAMSTDHYWGPTLRLFLREEDFDQGAALHEMFANRLPFTIAGYPVHFGDSPAEPGMAVSELRTEYPLRHHVFVHTVSQYTAQRLGWDAHSPLDATDWLTFPQQRLLELTAGAVFHDGVGELTALRQQLAYFPRAVWLYLLACGWGRLSQEEHLMPRAGYRGDELGSALIGARLVRDVMLLAFLMERRYAPYPKWYGTRFARLESAMALTPPLRAAQQATAWPERMSALAEAYRLLVRQHNALGLTEPLDEAPRSFFGRPFTIIMASRVTEALLAQIDDPTVRAIAEHTLIGSIDQFSDSTDLREAAALWPALKHLYG